MTPRLTIFRIFYSSTFTFLFLILFALLLITPGDLIARSRPDALTNIFTIAGAHVLVLILSFILYVSRIVSARRSISAIPRQPPSLNLPSRVKSTITTNLLRSAEIALLAQPKCGDAVHTGWGAPGGEVAGTEFAMVVEMLPVYLGAETWGGTLRAWVEAQLGEEDDYDGEVDTFLRLYERARFRRRGKGIPVDEFVALLEGSEKVLRRLREREREQRSAVSTATEEYLMDVMERITTSETGGSGGYITGAGSGGGGYTTLHGYGNDGSGTVASGPVSRITTTSTGNPSLLHHPPSSIYRGYESDVSRFSVNNIDNTTTTSQVRSFGSEDDTSTGGGRVRSSYGMSSGLKHRATSYRASRAS
ncbi:hypothetical protein EX30DRAFT_339078 [Ascodesmis nigricans]|uniref:Defect at low temperature protein 1 n=1 Tax=Ascodesmis nigricans TaxID=341454 RepID=A0A4S2N102_9PEZI|nr:hypothetical protein EX30DRAFT_339078 [Ascodesmis nigricans]